MLGLPDHVHAGLFDLDGVLTDTASLHRTAWKQTFDAYLAESGQAPFKDDDPPGRDTVHGVGNRKNELLEQLIHRDGVVVYDGSRRYLELARDAGLARALVSSSANARAVLKVTGLDPLLSAIVDGHTVEQQHLSGKPAPDSFLAGAKLLGVAPAAAAVFEDAIAGVAAGRAGRFGYVVGVNRLDAEHARQLRANGADIVVSDLMELLQ